MQVKRVFLKIISSFNVFVFFKHLFKTSIMVIDKDRLANIKFRALLK